VRKRFLSKGKDRALLDSISVMNQPVRDEQNLQAAGVQLEQMLFPLLMAVGRHGRWGVSWRII
jgi:hypothetical protein